MDLLGHFLRIAPDFRGRGRLTHHWLHRARSADRRKRTLPGGAVVECDTSIPYEAMVWLGREEQDDLLALQRLLQPGQTFVDCGANIGLWSLVAASAVGSTGRVVAFEPNPDTHARLRRHIGLNALTSIVTAHPSACGEAEGQVPFHRTREHNVSRIAAEPSAETVEVPITTLDRELGNSTVHGLKIDVEGHELQVLRGADALLRRCRPWLCVEFNSQFTTSPRLRDWDVHQHLASSGYRCRLFTAPADDAPLPEDWEVHGYTNLFYWPTER